jgi:hypothetical protein
MDTGAPTIRQRSRSVRPGPLCSVSTNVSECSLDEPLELVLLVGTPVVGGPGMADREEVETQPGEGSSEI